MSLTGIFRSSHQRRLFLLTSALIIAISVVVIWAIYYFAPDTRGWNTLNSLLVSVVASAVFAVVSALYLSYFFIDTEHVEARTRLIPQDIGGALRSIASEATDYKIFVRTGRHFRAEILPILRENAVRRRRAINVEVVLLDFRDDEVCEKYANYRRTASFDRILWDTSYVRKEVMATILDLAAASSEYKSFLNISLFLSDRLSTFRIEGSSQEIIVTREDPKDMAFRYPRSDSDHAAFLTEFSWIRDFADPVVLSSGPHALEEMLGKLDVIVGLEQQAQESRASRSPYAR
ncbi:hypothetical protein [Pararhizobium sp. O133]|uniref:hypothetical protein n=1 Tax=Pararhizobium sp. O133 TaxID=3449278 RepID=UPI003F689184